MSRKKPHNIRPNSLANLRPITSSSWQNIQKCAKPGCNAIAATKARNSKYCKHHGGRTQSKKPRNAPEKDRRRAVYAARHAYFADLEARYKDFNGLNPNLVNVIYKDFSLDKAAAIHNHRYQAGEITWTEYRDALKHLDTLQKPHIRDKVRHD